MRFLSRSAARRAALLALAGALSAGAAAGQAEGVVEPAPIIPLHPDDVEAAEPTEPMAIARLRDMPRQTAEPASWMAPLRAEGGGGVARLVGESAGVDLRLVLPEGPTPKVLRIVHRSSIDVLAERSMLTATVNGVRLEPLRPAAFAGFEVAMLPTDALRPGENHVRIEAAQHHRIYCGPEASFALWTDIDLASSGAALATAPQATIGGFAAALAAQMASPHPVEVRLSDDADPSVAQEALVALAAIEDDAQRSLRTRSVWSPAQSGQVFARVVATKGERDAVDVVRGGDGALVLRIVSAAGMSEPLRAALRAAMPPARAAPAPRPLTPGVQTPLSALGFPGLADAGHYIRRDVAFSLPRDWLILASEKARLILRYRFADNLPDQSILLVKINDDTIGLLPLDRGDGGAHPALEIPFAASKMRPGVNRLTFEAVIPGAPAALPCAPRDAPALEVFADTEILAPEAPPLLAPGMAAEIAALGGGDVAMASGAFEGARGRYTLAPLLALTPMEPGRAVSLTVLPGDQAEAMPEGALDIDPALLSSTLAAPAGAATVRPTANEAGPLGSFADLASSAFAMLRDAAFPGDPPLSEWLAGRRAAALLIQPDPAVPGALWLLVDGATDSQAIARAIDLGRRTGRGPEGHVAVLSPDGDWSSWTSPHAPPRLAGSVDWRNGRAVIGAYASWAPAAFTASGVGLAWISAVFAILFVIRSRGSNAK